MLITCIQSGLHCQDGTKLNYENVIYLQSAERCKNNLVFWMVWLRMLVFWCPDASGWCGGVPMLRDSVVVCWCGGVLVWWCVGVFVLP